MKKRILLLSVMGAAITSLPAQDKKPLTGYAITAAEAGGRAWREVRLININTGEEMKSIFSSKEASHAYNARTGKEITIADETQSLPVNKQKVVNLDQVLAKTEPGNQVVFQRVYIRQRENPNKPFATNSAAMAFDKKHERIYYTPMGINQLRYIDLKNGSNKIYFFENEAFGVVSGMGDGSNQITRMVIASDGNGYALSNDANHLIRFTTGKKTEITDLGALTDHTENAKYSVHSRGGFGGDMIADASGNLYLITANRNVFKISIASREAKYTGTIKGLPAGFSTNGAMAEGGSQVIIASSESIVGYYRFDLNTMQAEKVSTSATVYNASDLANGILAFDRKKDKKEAAEAANKNETSDVSVKQVPAAEINTPKGISVYPNPVTDGQFKLSFADQSAGKYQVQVLDLSGKLITTQDFYINSKYQTASFSLPELLSRGNYIVKVFSEINNVSVSTKLVVQ